jgi:CheY-like chemotaxis protein
MPYRNILLIDDDEDDQEIFMTALEKVDSTIYCDRLFDAREALSKLNAQEISPDLIFLDLNMPVMNGQQFLAAIKKIEELKNIPVIILSTSSLQSTKQLTKELGAMDFHSKPENFQDLVKILKSILT